MKSNYTFEKLKDGQVGYIVATNDGYIGSPRPADIRMSLESALKDHGYFDHIYKITLEKVDLERQAVEETTTTKKWVIKDE